MSEKNSETVVKTIDNAGKSYEGFRPYIFISYARVDAESVYKILNKLKEYRYRFWYDEGIKVGRNYANELYTHVSKSNTLLVFLSKAAIMSKHVINEVGIAFDNDQTIVPIWLGTPVPLPHDLEYWIRHTQQHSSLISDEKGLDSLVEKLLSAIPDTTRDISVIEDGVYISAEETIRDITFGDEVQSIAPEAFKNRTKLATARLSGGITRIGNEAFRNCKSLTEMLIPSNVQYLGDSAFRDCINLQKVKIEKSKKVGIEIGERAFENCTSLTHVELPPDIAEIYSGVFNSCKSLEYIEIPNSVTVIGDNAFGSCLNLKKLDLPPSVTRIDDAAFTACNGLTEVKLPDATAKLGKNVFKDCINLRKITLSRDLWNLGTSSFRGCSALEEIAVDPANKYYRVSDGVLYNKNKSMLVRFAPKLPGERFEVPDSVTEVCDWAFSDCEQLHEIVITDCVERIGEGAFFRCVNLERVVIPDSVTAIEDTAFRGCTKLKEVVIESTAIRELGWGIFYGCNPDMVIKYAYSKKVEDYCKDKPFKHIVLDR